MPEELPLEFAKSRGCILRFSIRRPLFARGLNSPESVLDSTMPMFSLETVIVLENGPVLPPSSTARIR